MLVTFIIGLREGLEAALIVGIVAAFLLRNEERQSLKHMWLGVGLAVGLCLAIAVGLTMAGRHLSDRASEVLEGSLTLLAVAGVTYMLVWMKRHSRELRSDLEDKTARALDRNSAWALIGLAFIAVLREGLETSIFLLAILNGSPEAPVGIAGAVAGIGVASLVGYGIFKGGARINLSRFFRVTGVFLVIVAAGLLASSVHEFAEAGVLTVGQGSAFDLSRVFTPGTIHGGLATAFLGFQPVPTHAEIAAWLLFLIPAGWYVLRPPGPARSLARS